MPLYKGNTRLGLYLGAKKIVGIYEGTTPFYSSFSWQEWYNEYIYNAIIPTTLNNKQVQDKAKLFEIEGNGVIENQLNMHPNDMSKADQFYANTGVGDAGYIGYNGTPNTNAAPSSILTRTVEENGTVATTTFIDNSPAGGNIFTYYYFRFFGSNFDLATSRYGHKMLLVCDMKTSVSNVKAYMGSGTLLTTSNLNSSWKQVCQIIELTSSNRTIGIGFNGNGISCSAGDYFSIRNVRFVDLTQRYGTGLEPTSLTDNCIQKILNSGNVPYNTGTYKSTIVGEVVATGRNLLDTSTRILGKIKNDNGVEVNDSSSYYSQMILVQPNQKLTSNFAVQRLYYYDISGNWIGRSGIITDSRTYIIPSNTYFIQVQVQPSFDDTNVYIQYGDTLSTVVPYLQQQYLPSEYQEVEYLESTGTQYIQLSFGFDDTDELYTRFAMDISQTSGYKFLISPISWNENNNRFALGLYNGDYTFGYGSTGTQSGRFSPLTSNDGKPHNWSYKNHIAQVLDLGLYANVSGITFGGTTATLRLFYGYQQPSMCKLYSYKHYKNNVLIINLIPCYRKSDNVAGLYDLVNNLFYTNNGTGTFKVGKKVNNNTMIKLPAPLDLGGARNSHNTFEITKTEYVFTRDNVVSDLSTVGNWSYRASTSTTKAYFQVVISNPALVGPQVSAWRRYNILCNAYQSVAEGELYYSDQNYYHCISQWYDRFRVNDDTYTDVNSFVQHLQDVNAKVIHQLATPQVIRIPRKHLGCVDLGSLVWEWSNSASTWVSKYKVSNITIPSSSSTLPNMFCGKYMTNISSSSSVSSKDNIVFTGNQYVYVKDTTNLPSTLTATQVQNLLSGVYLYYETQDEVQDFNDEMFIQSGGTVNTDSEVLPNLTLGVKCK